jgi:hypothetical protein
MSFPVTCPECDSTQNVPNEAAGKRLRCKSCQAVFRAGNADVDIVDEGPPPARRERPRDDGDRPQSRRPRDEADEPAPRKRGRTAGRKKSSLSVVLVAIGGFVVVAGLGIGIAWMAGAFELIPQSEDGKGGGTSAGAGGGAGAGGRKLKFGSPPPLTVEQAQVTAVRRTENGRDGIDISFRFINGHRRGDEHALVVVFPEGSSTDFLKHASMGDVGQRPIRIAFEPGASSSFEIWIGKLRPDDPLGLAPDRVSNVVRID